ncbi:MAG: hypothetical protein QME58_02045 [Bacteroidota bacterium]|nr:hypothetical protein [Bacteroidota bacterium]
MARSIPALVNHRLLEWVRKEAGYTDEEAAEKLKRSVEELEFAKNSLVHRTQMNAD